jgi:hypothetical protein
MMVKFGVSHSSPPFWKRAYHHLLPTENPKAPFLKGGNAYTPASLLDARAVLKPLQAFTSSPFDKGGQRDFKKSQAE